MTLEKAIELLSSHGLKPKTAKWQDYLDAAQLGVEAMKRWKERHGRCPDDINFLLPGETKD